MALLVFFVCLPFFLAFSEVITRLHTQERVVAITLDACETKTPSYLDKGITDYLIANKIPFTLFVSGKFLKRNWEEIKKLHMTSLVSIQNHSMNHYLHMERLLPEMVIKEVRKVEELIIVLASKKPRYFRFPGGNYDKKTLRLVENLGYKVVHWTFPSGNADKRVTPEKLIAYVFRKH